MNRQITALTNRPALRRVGQIRFMRLCRTNREHCASRTGHPCLQSLGAQPIDGLGDRGAKPLSDRLQVVSTEIEDPFESLRVVCSKARDYSRSRGPLKIRRNKNRLGVQALGRLGHHDLGWRQRDRGDLLTDAFHPRIAPAQEKGHVRAKAQADLFQLRKRQVQAPEPVERQQTGGGIRGAAAHAGLRRDALGNADVGAEARQLEPHVVFVDADNKIMGTGSDPADTFGDETLSRGDLVAR